VRTPASLLVLVLLAGCAARAPRAAGREAVLGRPGDAARTSILDLDRGEPLPAASADPLPHLGRADLCAQPLESCEGARGACELAPRPSPATRFGPWRLTNSGDAALPLSAAWRMRVGLAAGGTLPDASLPEPGRTSRRTAYPGVRLECDL
jgi:hypothetical protein